MKKIILILFLYSNLNLIDGSCLLRIPSNQRIAPIYRRHIGSRYSFIENSHHEGEIILYEGETITGNCATKFRDFLVESKRPCPNSRNYYDADPCEETEVTKQFDLHEILVKCNASKILVLPFGELVDSVLFCENFDFKLFETNNPLPWCGIGTVSYILATELYENKKILGGLCYNLQNMTLESLRYLADENLLEINAENFFNASNSLNLDEELIGLEVRHFEELFKGSNWDSSHKLKTAHTHDDLADLFHVALFNEDFISQNGPLATFFENYNDLLKINWWHGLKNGNWRRFMNVFKRRALEVTYDVYIGASGKTKMPQYEDCRAKEFAELKYKLVEYHGKFPAYIWMYVRAVNQSEQFVFIGFNSPFYEFFNKDESIFCKDICHEISWLKGIRSTFRFSTLGVTFCCSPEEVRNSTILSGFPKAYVDEDLVEKQQPVTSSTNSISRSKSKWII